MSYSISASLIEISKILSPFVALEIPLSIEDSRVSRPSSVD